jgi:hypothetical protein
MATPASMPKKARVLTVSDDHPRGNWEDLAPIPNKTFHGTDSAIPGDKVLPASVHGGHTTWGTTGSHSGQSSKDNTFSTPNESEAWEWAGKGYGRRNPRDPSVRRTVYEVAPGPRARWGTEIAGEVVADHHTITGRQDIMPGRQGTFPDLNWNQFKGSENDEYDEVDVNHPSDSAVKYGHGMVDDAWTPNQADEMTRRYAQNDMASDLQWDRGDRVTRESRRDRRFGEQGALFPESKDVGANRKKEAEIDHLRHPLTSPVQR